MFELVLIVPTGSENELDTELKTPKKMAKKKKKVLRTGIIEDIFSILLLLFLIFLMCVCIHTNPYRHTQSVTVFAGVSTFHVKVETSASLAV